MEIILKGSRENSGDFHVIVDNKWVDRLTKDEALGVVASALFSDNPMYVRTTEEHAAKAKMRGLKPVALLPAPSPKIDYERLWETTMMKAIGKDGPQSAAEAIDGLKRSHEKALTVLAELLKQVDLRCGGKAAGSSPLVDACDAARDVLTPAYHAVGTTP